MRAAFSQGFFLALAVVSAWGFVPPPLCLAPEVQRKQKSKNKEKPIKSMFLNFEDGGYSFSNGGGFRADGASANGPRHTFCMFFRRFQTLDDENGWNNSKSGRVG